jgi:hypothetical protein
MASRPGWGVAAVSRQFGARWHRHLLANECIVYLRPPFCLVLACIHAHLRTHAYTNKHTHTRTYGVSVHTKSGTTLCCCTPYTTTATPCEQGPLPSSEPGRHSGRHSIPTPKKKKHRPPWVDNSIAGAPKPFAPDPTLSSSPADEAQKDSTSATPLLPSSPRASKLPGELSRIPRQPPGANSEPPRARSANSKDSISRIPHEATISPPARQRKHWEGEAQQLSEQPVLEIRPPQLGKCSPVPVPSTECITPRRSLPQPDPASLPLEGGVGAFTPSTPLFSPARAVTPVNPSPISALRASAVENLKDRAKDRALQSR